MRSVQELNVTTLQTAMRVTAPTSSFSNRSRTVDERLLDSMRLLAIVVALLSISSTNDVVIRHVEEGVKRRAAGCGRMIEVHCPICTLSQAAATQIFL